MAAVGNLIDFMGCDEPQHNESPIEEPATALVSVTITAANCFEVPYDPFDSVANEACLKGLNHKEADNKCTSDTNATTDIPVSTDGGDYPDLNSESPPVGMSGQIENQRGKNGSFQKQLLKLSLSNSSIMGTPTQNQSKSSRNAGLQFENSAMLAAESPIKFIEDDMPKVSGSQSSTNFEADLKMLRIPMLDTLPKEEEHAFKLPANAVISAKKVANSPPQLPTAPVKDVGQLLQELKALVRDNVDKCRKQQFYTLIEAISAAISANSKDAEAAKTPPGLPHTYTRQGTFDIELQQQEKENAAAAESQQLLLAGSQKQDEFPDIMTSSSATYDAEPQAEDRDIIDVTPPPISSGNDAAFMTQVMDENLVQQISELLHRQHLMKDDETQHNDTTGHRPTVILVMNNGGQLPPSCVVHPSPSRASQVADVESSNSSMRRRSSSLSIHDKSTNLFRGRAILKQHSSDENTPLLPAKELSNLTNDIKSTAARAAFRQRRNSFSIGSSTNKTNPNLGAAQPKLYDNAKMILGARNKNAGLGESIVKSNGPMKAIIPIKRVMPIMKTHNEPNGGESTYLSAHSNARLHDTSLLQPTAKSGKTFHTSTPMSQLRSQPRSSIVKPASNYLHVNAGSTPTVRRASFSNSSSASAGMAKGRLSCASSTAMLKAKSPLKFSQDSVIRKVPAKFKM